MLKEHLFNIYPLELFNLSWFSPNFIWFSCGGYVKIITDHLIIENWEKEHVQTKTTPMNNIYIYILFINQSDIQ